MCTYPCTLPLKNKPSEYVLHNLEIGMQSHDSESGQRNLEIARLNRTKLIYPLPVGWRPE